MYKGKARSGHTGEEEWANLFLDFFAENYSLTNLYSRYPTFENTMDYEYFGLTEEFKWQRKLLMGFQMPYVCIIGNHDCLGTGEDVYHKMYGDDNFSFNASFLHVLCLNTNAFEYDYSQAIPDFSFIKDDLAAVPEVALVAVLDADKEGFLRSARSLTQTAGRAARNVNGRVIFYASAAA